MNKTSNFKKIVSAVLVLMMVMTTLVIVPMTANAAAAWDGSTVDTSWVNDNTGADWDHAYLIADAADLAGWSQLSNADATQFAGKYFKLTADIDLGNKTFTPIKGGTVGDASIITGAVHLDGQNFIISNMKPTAANNGVGFFSVLGNESEIRNLHFVGATLVGSNAWNPCCGVLAGMCSMYKCTFYNISVDETSSVSGGRHMGGIIGSAAFTGANDADTDKSTFEYVVNAADITASNYNRIGGLIGHYQNPNNVSFSYCVNKGDLKATGAQSGSMGGIIGGCMDGGGDKNQIITLDHCYNTGNMTLGTGNFAHSSGMVGDFYYANNSTLTITNCYDYSTRTLQTANGTTCPMAIGSGQSANADKITASLNVTLTNCYAAPSAAWGASSRAASDYAAAAAVLAGTETKVALSAYSDIRNNNVAETPVTNSYMVKDLDATIELTEGGQTSTIRQEMAKIDSEIASKSLKDVQINISPVTARISLKDPYGFMLITDIQYTSNGADAALADVAEYGFYFLVADAGQELTATDLIANENAVKADGEAYDGSTTKFASAYTALSAAKLDATVYFVAYATMAKGGVSKTVYSQVRSASPLTFVEDFKDGYIGVEGAAGAEKIENGDEVLTYGAMYDYHIAYKEYLDSVKNPQA